MASTGSEPTQPRSSADATAWVPQQPAGNPAYVPPQTAWASPTWPPHGWQSPEPAKHHGRFGVGPLVAAFVVAAIVFGSVGFAAGYVFRNRGASNTAAGRSRTTLGASSPSPSASSSSAAGAGTALLAMIVPPPPGAKTYHFASAPSGILTLDQDVKEFFSGSTTEAGVLRQQGYVISAARDYLRPDGLEIVTHLTQFAADDGADSYFFAQVTSYSHDPKVTGTYVVPGGGTAYEKNALDSLGNRRTFMVERVGDVVVVVTVYTPGKFNRGTDLKIMAAQIAAMH